jgi:hypothetical protein
MRISLALPFKTKDTVDGDAPVILAMSLSDTRFIMLAVVLGLC